VSLPHEKPIILEPAKEPIEALRENVYRTVGIKRNGPKTRWNPSESAQMQLGFRREQTFQRRVTGVFRATPCRQISGLTALVE
jgi:hypothetical protein